MQRSAYATVGVQMQPGIRMNVRSNVFVPDAEAGGEDQRQQFFAGSHPAQGSRQPVTIRKGFAAVILLTAFFFMAVLIAGRAVSLNNLRVALSDSNQEILKTEDSLAALQRDIADAQDAMRIAYMAEQQFGMVYANQADAVPITAPETRYGQDASYLSGSRESSPLSQDLGMITGRR